MQNNTEKDYKAAENKMNKLLAIATEKGGFNQLTKLEKIKLDKYTQIVNRYEEQNFIIPIPETIQGIIALKMFELNLKQKELAKLLEITDTKLSEIMHNKRKPNVSFLKALHRVLDIDGNLLLKIV